ncbi:hypothetical protein ACWD01_33535 [Streptomyces sp. NPDC002835]
MTATSTALLLQLAAVDGPTELEQRLPAGHAAWCAGFAAFRSEVTMHCEGLSAAELADRCAQAGAQPVVGLTRDEAVAELAFALWECTPASIAYTEAAERAAELGICLVDQW